MSDPLSVEALVAGTESAAVVRFFIPYSTLTNAAVTWNLVDDQGVVWNSGVASDVETKTLTGAYALDAECTISIPTKITATARGTRYYVLYSLTATELSQALTSQDSLIVYQPSTTQLGPISTVSITQRAGFATHWDLNLGLEEEATALPTVSVFHNNTQVATGTSSLKVASTPDGVTYVCTIDTSTFWPQVSPFTVIWEHDGDQEIGAAYLITPQTAAAIREVRNFLNKAHSQWNDPNVLFTEDQIMDYLVRGRDLFNAAHLLTDFNMNNATGPIRSMWLGYSCLYGLRAQYLNSAEKAFEFSGLSVNLNSDRSQYYESAASTLESQLNDACRPLKIALAKAGLTGGDGSANPNHPRMVAAVGITLSPTSRWTMFNPNGWWMNPPR